MKKLTASFLIFLMLLTLSACKGGDKPAPAEPDQQAENTAEPTAEPTDAPANETEPAVTLLPTEAPTEAPVHKQTEDPNKLDEHDYALLRDFFEQKDENGVANGAKCFPDYDPDDVDTWYDGSYNYDNYVGWDRGKVRTIKIMGAGSEPLQLKGKLCFGELKKLAVVNIRNAVIEELDASDLPVAKAQNNAEINVAMVRGEAAVSGGFIYRLRVLSAAHMYCDITGEATSNLEKLPSFKLDLTVDGEGYAGVNAYSDENYYVVKLVAKAMEGRDFVGWYDANGKLVSTDAEFELFGEQTGDSADGAHAEFVYYARFN